jgi:hypothetical protein
MAAAGTKEAGSDWHRKCKSAGARSRHLTEKNSIDFNEKRTLASRGAQSAVPADAVDCVRRVIRPKNER